LIRSSIGTRDEHEKDNYSNYAGFIFHFFPFNRFYTICDVMCVIIRRFLWEGLYSYVARGSNPLGLPTYDIFDENRYFEPGMESVPYPYKGHSIGLTVCEDDNQDCYAA